MSKRDPRSLCLGILFAMTCAHYAAPNVAEAADLAVPRRLASQPVQRSFQPDIAQDRADLTGAIKPRATDPAGTEAGAGAADRARSARASFRDLRAAMEREISLREVVSKDRLEALEVKMANVSEQLSTLSRSGRHSSPDKAAEALKQVQNWYQEGLKIINPSTGGLTELPLPMSLSDKADVLAVALDRVLEDAAASPPARAPRKRSIVGLKPVTSNTIVVPDSAFH